MTRSRHEYLEKHGNQWRVQKKVPPRLRPVIGKAKLVRSLGTDSLVEANRMKWPIVLEFDQLILQAEAEIKRRGAIIDPLIKSALEYRDEYTKAQQSPFDAADFDHLTGEMLADGPSFVRDIIDDRTTEIKERQGPERASLFNGIALGTATPILLLVDDWLAERRMKPRQNIDYRRAVTKLDAWLTTNRRRTDIEGVTRKVAGTYISKAFSALGKNARTTNKDISCLSSYWAWLKNKGHIEDNIWKGQSVPEPRQSKEDQKRPYTDQELATLLAGNSGALLSDAIQIAALSGMRADEIARLTVGHATAERIEIPKAKTAAGERTVPVHPNLRDIIERRLKDKQPSDFLFHEIPTPKANSAVERSQKITKAFVRYRRSLGVDDRPPDARQSRIDFHSLRRWFITKAAHALNHGATGYSQWTIAQVVGHSKEDGPLAMTMGRYAGDDSFEAMKACVEAVNLPLSASRMSVIGPIATSNS